VQTPTVAQFPPALKHPIRRARLVALYYLSWVVFGAVGLLLNVGCMVLLLLPGGLRWGPRSGRRSGGC